MNILLSESNINSYILQPHSGQVHLLLTLFPDASVSVVFPACTGALIVMVASLNVCHHV